MKQVAFWVALMATSVISFTADASGRDISKVLGGVDVNTGEVVGDISSVNGGVSMSDASVARSVETVNGSVELGRNVKVDSVQTVNGGIVGETDIRVAKGLSTVNGAIRLSSGSEVTRDLETVNGDIELEGSVVGGDLTTSNGDILLSATHLKGDLVVRKNNNKGWGQPRKLEITIDATSRIDGKLLLHRKVDLTIADGAIVGEVIKYYE